jgi:hypothetical protein
MRSGCFVGKRTYLALTTLWRVCLMGCLMGKRGLRLVSWRCVASDRGRKLQGGSFEIQVVIAKRTFGAFVWGAVTQLKLGRW